MPGVDKGWGREKKVGGEKQAFREAFRGWVGARVE